jgi:hypothetical protein
MLVRTIAGGLDSVKLLCASRGENDVSAIGGQSNGERLTNA